MTDPTESIRKALASDHPREEIDLEAIRALLDRLDSAERERDEAKAFARWFAHKVQTQGPSANLCAEALPIAMHLGRSGEQKEPK